MWLLKSYSTPEQQFVVFHYIGINLTFLMLVFKAIHSFKLLEFCFLSTFHNLIFRDFMYEANNLYKVKEKSWEQQARKWHLFLNKYKNQGRNKESTGNSIFLTRSWEHIMKLRSRVKTVVFILYTYLGIPSSN